MADIRRPTTRRLPLGSVASVRESGQVDSRRVSRIGPRVAIANGEIAARYYRPEARAKQRISKKQAPVRTE